MSWSCQASTVSLSAKSQSSPALNGAPHSNPTHPLAHPPTSKAGDTDTNAAIVGGMLGALWGAGAIPDYMSSPVLAYEGREDQGGGVPRPPELRAAVLPGLARLLFEAATAEG